MADYSSLEKLYTKGILDMNPKDYMNGTNSNAQIKPREDVFLPDNRFVQVDGNYMRDQLDRDHFQKESFNTIPTQNTNFDFYKEEDSPKKNKIVNNVTNVLTSKFVAGTVATLAFIFSARYILKKLHIIK